MIRKGLFAASLVSSAALFSSHAAAQPYPSKPVRLVVPYPAGGGTDVFARLLASKLTESLGKQVLVENKAGAQGSVGLAAVAKSAPDGYVLAVSESGCMTMIPWLYKNPGFDPIKDFDHVTLGVTYPNAVVSYPGVPARTLKELAALAKTKPNEMTFASASAVSQLAGQLFQIVAGVKMLEVPYKGAGPAATDLAGGHVDVMIAASASAIPLVKAGKIQALAVTGPQRIPALPDVPTSKESGFPDFEVLSWYGFAAPAGTPKDVVSRLNKEITSALRTPEIANRLAAAGLEPKASSPEEMTRIVRSDYDRWGKVVKTVGITPN